VIRVEIISGPWDQFGRPQTFDSRYQLHLPTEEELRAELKREIEWLDPSSGDEPA
jgi:hypothetical protein